MRFIPMLIFLFSTFSAFLDVFGKTFLWLELLVPATPFIASEALSPLFSVTVPVGQNFGVC